MTLQKQIDSDFIFAMKTKEAQKVSVLRMVKSALKNKEIDKGRELSEEEMLEVVAREVKQRKDSAFEFEKGGRSELAQKENAEIKVLEKYLPKQLEKKEISKLIDKAISETSAKTASDMGKIMGKLMPQIKGKADGSLVSKLVRDRLGK